MSEEVAGAAAGGKPCGGGLKVVQASADRPGKWVEGASILWIHTSGIVIWSGGLSLAAKALQLDRTIKESRWQCDAGPRLGVAWSGNELVFNPRRRLQEGAYMGC
jgi:hypothetical protein